MVELGTGGVSSGAANIGTWSDDGGLSIIKNGISHSRPGSESYGKKTTYVLTSVLEEVRLSKLKLCVYRWDIVGVKVVSAVYHTTLRKELRNERFLSLCRTEKKICSLLFIVSETKF